MNEILNQAQIDYQYRINPAGPDLEDTINSNETEVNRILGELSMTKSVDKEYATIGDILTYTVVLNNIGNILLTNINFQDILPSELTFVTGSVMVDSVSEPTYDPNTGFDLGSLLILGSITVQFQATVNSLPDPNKIDNFATTTYNYLVIIPVSGDSTSNTVTTTINVTNLEVVKTSSVPEAQAGDTITYTITVENKGNIDATNILFTDPVDSLTTFVAGSVEIDSVAQPTYDPNIGFNLPTIAPNTTVTVTFDVTVN